MLKNSWMARFAAVMIALVALGAVRSTTAAQQLRDLTFFLPFIPNIQFSPVYAAIANGYFADEGLNVTIEYGDENVAVELLAVNELQFGMISGEQVILARGGGRPVVYVYEWFQQFPIGIVIPDTSGIETVGDLAGRRVGIPGLFGASYSGLIALLGANDLAETDVQLQAIGFVAPDVVCAGGVEASVVYVNNEPLQIQQRANAGQCGEITRVTVLRVAEYADIVANGITTNAETIEDDPELVAAVVRAFDSGLRDAINNPARAYLASSAFVEGLPMSTDLQAVLETLAGDQEAFLETSPDRAAVAESRAAVWAALSEQFPPDLLLQFEVLLATIDLWDADQLGMTDPASWDATQALLVEIGALQQAFDLDGSYTNAFVPSVQSE